MLAEVDPTGKILNWKEAKLYNMRSTVVIEK